MYGKPLLLFDNMLSTGAVAIADGTATGDYNIANLSDFRPYTWWQSGASDFYTIIIDNTTDRSADFIYLSGAAFSNVQFSLISYDAGFVNSVLHLSSSGNSGTEFFATFPSHSQQIWKLTVITGNSVTPLSNVVIGSKLELPRNLQQGFDPLGSKPRGRLSKSSKGQPLGIAESWREWKQKIRFNNIDSAWLRSTWQPAFDSHLRNTPSVFVWDPVDHPTELYLVHPVYDYAAPHMQGQFANLSFTLEGLAP